MTPAQFEALIQAIMQESGRTRDEVLAMHAVKAMRGGRFDERMLRTK